MAGTNTEVLERTEVKEPGLYNVIFLNDDSTPMDFVVYVLEALFGHTQETAYELTMKIHNEGRGVAGTYPYDIAESKQYETTALAQANGYPLRIKVEPENDQ